MNGTVHVPRCWRDAGVICECGRSTVDLSLNASGYADYSYGCGGEFVWATPGAKWMVEAATMPFPS
jgi:hypothetical protein